VARLRLGTTTGGGESEPATWIIAIGKAAPAMTAGAVSALAAAACAPVGGVVVGADERDAEMETPSHPSLRVLAGDHPVPGARSLAAADAIGEVVRCVRPDDRVLVLLSGGASSLAAAPATKGVTIEDLARLAELLLASGLDVAAMNAVRKRFARWGAGRLAAALAPARVHCLVVSDVIGDPLSVVGSGPCVGDPTTAGSVVARLEAAVMDRGATLWSAIPEAVRAYLERAARGEEAETPKPDDASFRRVSVRVILNNADALTAAAARAFDHGIAPVEVRHALSGEASACGGLIIEQLVALRDRCRAVAAPAAGARRACLIWGGETTVTRRATADGVESTPPSGGRCQELALAAARALYALGDDGAGITLLAAGTDGRDGPTDAAGAIVDDATWECVRDAGRDPARDLACHDAHPALDAAGALLRTGLTGTNVMDVVIGIVNY
jgi:hydroxypyruvate reductase